MGIPTVSDSSIVTGSSAPPVVQTPPTPPTKETPPIPTPQASPTPPPSSSPSFTDSDRNRIGTKLTIAIGKAFKTGDLTTEEELQEVSEDILTIIAPIKGSPAEKSGLKAGDKVLKIDDKFTSELTLDEAVHLIRGEQDTTVLLTIARNDDDKPREVKVTRNVIKLPAITTGKEKDDIFIYGVRMQATF